MDDYSGWWLDQARAHERRGEWEAAAEAWRSVARRYGPAACEYLERRAARCLTKAATERHPDAWDYCCLCETNHAPTDDCRRNP